MTAQSEETHSEHCRAAREALVGKTIAGRYVVRGLLGHGGMGAVYEAEHLGLGKRVAIKFVDPEFATDEQVIARFAREARAMSTIESAHIVTVFDAGTEDGRPYLVMELLRGEDLGQRLRRLRRVPVSESLHIIAQVLKGLARAHAAGIVHRDLKPDNVFLVKSDTDPLFAKIVDFGISKIERPRASTSPLALTGRGTVLGTPLYMSPEQAQASSDVDGRADLFSVGAILFECLTGRPPHTGETYEQIILSICMRDAPPVHLYNADIAEDVSAFVARSLARKREERFASAEQMLAALHEVAPVERTRVPLDVPSETLLSNAARPGDATVLDSAPPRSSHPSDPIGAATRFGVGSLDPALGTALEEAVQQHREERQEQEKRAPERSSSSGDPTIPVSGKVPAVSVAPSVPPPSAAPVSARPRPAAPRPAPARAPRPIGAAIITAVVATLLGIGVTFGVITLMENKERGASAQPSASVSAPKPAPSTTPSAITSATSVTPAPDGAPPTSAAPSTSASHAPAPHSVPRPATSKPLDINRSF